VAPPSTLPKRILYALKGPAAWRYVAADATLHETDDGTVKADGSAFTAGVWQPLFSKYRGPQAASGVDALDERATTADDALTVAAPYFLVVDTLLTVAAGLARGSQGIREPSQRCVGPSIAVAVVNTMALVLLVLFRPLTSRPKLAVSVAAAVTAVVTSWLLAVGIHRADRSIIELSLQVATFSVYWGYLAFSMSIASYAADLASGKGQRLVSRLFSDAATEQRPAGRASSVGLRRHSDEAYGMTHPFLLMPSAAAPRPRVSIASPPPPLGTISTDSATQPSIPEDTLPAAVVESGCRENTSFVNVDDTIERPSKMPYPAPMAHSAALLAASDRDQEQYTKLSARAIRRSAHHQHLYDELEGLLAGRSTGGQNDGNRLSSVTHDGGIEL
jgi:hypothetical protein